MKEYPRDLIFKATGERREFAKKEDVPPGWFTVDGDEVNPSEGEVVTSDGGKAGQGVSGGGVSDSVPKPKKPRKKKTDDAKPNEGDKPAE